LLFHINGRQRRLVLAHQHLIKVIIEALVASIHSAKRGTILQLLHIVKVSHSTARDTLHVVDKSSPIHILISLLVLLMQLTLATSMLLVSAGDEAISVHHVG